MMPTQKKRSSQPAEAFHYRNGRLYCESVPIDNIIEAVGTPCYVYSHKTLTEAFLSYQQAFSEVPHVIAFACKANANIAILQLFARMGGGADIVSGGELYRAERAGMDPQKIVFAGIGKTRAEMRAALKANILMFNIESEQEMIVLNEIAKEIGTDAPIALRVNPDVNPKTHPYISTGLKHSKFGIDVDSAVAQYKKAARLGHLRIVGIHSHIGSQLVRVRPFVDALKRIATLIHRLRSEGIVLDNWDIGGGLGIPYHTEVPPTPRDLSHAVLPLLSQSGCRIILEPGRFLVGNAGILVTRVLYTKSKETRRFVIVDAGMNDLVRPSLYGAYHHIVPVQKRRRKIEKADVVGPICESGDFLAQNRPLPEVKPEELLAVMSAGAYGFAMASNYNARPRPAEVLVQGTEFTLIRQRETYADLVRGEQMLPLSR